MSPKQLKVTGEARVNANIQRILRENWKDAKKAFRQEAEIIISDAVKQAPVEFGDLRRSKSVETAKDTKKELELILGFNATYAAAVHENLNAHHTVGKAKYLEDPLMARIDDIPKNVAKRVKAGMRL